MLGNEEGEGPGVVYVEWATKGAHARWSREQGAVLGNRSSRWVENRATDHPKVTENVARVEEVGESVCRWRPLTLDPIVRMLVIRNIRVMPRMAPSLNPPHWDVILTPLPCCGQHKPFWACPSGR